MDCHNDRIRELLMEGAHEEGDCTSLMAELAQAELFAVFAGDINCDPRPIGFNLDIYKQVLPVFTHEKLAIDNMRLEKGLWVDVISIRQAIHYVTAHAWHGVYLNFRERGWLLEGDNLRRVMEIIPLIA